MAVLIFSALVPSYSQSRLTFPSNRSVEIQRARAANALIWIKQGP
jgi:hypothetical protein